MNIRFLSIILTFTPLIVCADDLTAARESVRGDTGKWNDTPLLQQVPPLKTKPNGLNLDNWADQLTESTVTSTPADENWLLFRTRQLDDNDRVRVKKIERHGHEFTILMSEAIWQGYYGKTFTYYEVLAVNLGKLPAGDYTAKWVVEPLEFKLFDGDGKPQSRDGKPQNRPKDETAGKGKAVELTLAFSVKEIP
ncbi:MAG: hypothetical protein KA152_05920 [Verrucomicrobiales bacterium]|nr:hypothetical protein [Verrucomicrobiales bacterium]